MAKRRQKGAASKKPPKLKGVHDLVKKCLEEGRYIETWHGEARKGTRNITSLEMRHVLNRGRYTPSRDRYDPIYGDHGWSYAFEGLTLERRRLRVVVAFDAATQALIVTVVDLDRD